MSAYLAEQIVSRVDQWSTSHGVPKAAVRELIVGMTTIKGKMVNAFAAKVLHAFDSRQLSKQRDAKRG